MTGKDASNAQTRTTDLSDTAERLGDAQAQLTSGDRRGAFATAQAILVDHPNDAPALFLAIDAILSDDPGVALTLADTAVVAHPKRPLSHWKRGEALAKLGRHHEATQALEAASLLSGGNTVGILMALGRSHMQLDAFAEAEAAFTAALKLKPDAFPAHRSRSAALRGQGRTEAALALIDAALTAYPLARPLLEERIELMAARDDNAALVEFATPLFQKGTALSARSHLLYAVALTETGDPRAADDAYAAMLKSYPEHLSGHLNRIRLAHQSGAEAKALSHLATARTALPDEPALIEEDAAAALRRGDTEHAIQLLSRVTATHPKRDSAWSRMGQASMAHGEVDAGVSHLAKAVDLRPSNIAYRALLVDGLRRVGRTGEALVACYDDPSLEADTDLVKIVASADPAALRLPDTAFELCMGGEAEDALAQLATRLQSHLGHHPAARLARLAMLAQGRGLSELAAGCISQVGQAANLPLTAAKTVLELGHATQDAALFDGLVAMLSKRLTVADRDTFFLAAVELRDGARAALDHARNHPTSDRGEARMRQRLALLTRAGKSQTAYRYARWCRRALSSDVMILRHLHDACLQTGRTGEANDVLADMRALLPEREFNERRFRTTLAAGKVAVAHQMAMAEVDAAEFPYPFMHSILACVAMGDLDTGTRLSARFSARPHRNPAFTHHFRTTHPGSMLNELRLYRASAGGLKARRDAHLVANFFFPAQAVLRDWAEMQPMHSGAHVPPIPRRIIQYWDAPEVPKEVAELIAGWAEVPGFTHQLFSRDSARQWIGGLNDRSYLRAFRAAKNAAEEADFFRLLYLYRHGGIYTDADNRLNGDLAAACEGAQLVLFSETCGGVRNDLILTAPGHPIIGRALEMCTQALISFEKEITWAKTGPGLLTRAAASVVVEREGFGASDLDIRSEAVLRHLVHPAVALPYKATPAYWNDETGRVPEVLKASLAAILRGPWGTRGG